MYAAHEHVCGFVVRLCIVIVLLLMVVWFLTCVCLPPFFQMMTWPDPILELKKNQ